MFILFKRNDRNYKNIKFEEFKKIQEKNPDIKVLDVRSPGEVGQGKIPGSTNIDIMNRQFPEMIGKLNKDKHYLVYCRSGNRSGQACKLMAAEGFTNLYNLSGGIGGWLYETA